MDLGSMDNLLLRPNRVDPYDAAFFMGNQDWGQRRSIRAPEGGTQNTGPPRECRAWLLRVWGPTCALLFYSTEGR